MGEDLPGGGVVDAAFCDSHGINGTYGGDEGGGGVIGCFCVGGEIYNKVEKRDSLH